MKILVTDPEYFPQESIEMMKQVGEVVAKKFTQDELAEAVKDASALAVRVTTRIDKEIIDAATNLKLIASATTGLDHIDVDYARQKSIDVIGLPGLNTTSTAEFTFATLLSLSKRIPWAHHHLKSGKWERDGFFGNELEGKTLGLIGFGRIGRKVAQYAKAFGMNVIYFDPYVDKSAAKEVDAKEVPFDELLANSDFISIHAFLSKETENMISFEQFRKMKRNAMLINVSRGKIVDEDALVDALRNNLIAGSAVDVFSEEPATADNVLLKYASEGNNLLITPHIAGSSKESVRNASIFVAQKIKEVLSSGV